MGERLGRHERIGIDVVGDVRIRVGDIDPGGQEDQLIGLRRAQPRQRQGDDDGEAPSRTVSHENDPPALILRERAQAQVHDEPMRLDPRVMGRQRGEGHDEAGSRPADQVVDEQGVPE